MIRQVDLFTLRLFLSAIEEQQIGLAAIRENIAASTATKRIQVLEDIAGVELLERTPKGVAPTPAGLVLERHVREIFGSLDDMRAEIAALTEGVQGDLTVASARSIIVPFLARETGEFTREFPLVQVAFHETDNETVLAEVVRGDADLGVFAAAYDLDLEGLHVTPYREDRLVAVVPEGHALTAKSSLALTDLLAESLVAPRAMLGAIGAAARRAGVEFSTRHEVRSGEVALSMVQARTAVTVVPECMVDGELRSRLAVRELAESWAVRKLHIATPSGRTLSPAAAAYLQHLRSVPTAGPEATGA
ncbi:MAG: LysR substrate-binding domain-containing protein [Gordonia sp. (in: high G+C Gram-positive bacteria)]|uniref:LysR family transcriptional regulator n=1 Tax=Gordonia sp. (in: high G+C Gram-positive bacteria) TaxID=84139 RepID=UPI0039E39B9F